MTQSLESLFTLYHSRVIASVMRKMGCRRDLAEDAAQHAFLAFHEKQMTFTADSPMPLLVTMAIHHVQDVYSSASRRKDRSLDAPLENGQQREFPDVRESAEPDLPLELLPRVMALLSTMDMKFADMLTLKFLKGMSAAQIGKYTGLHSTTVHRRIAAGLARIRKALGVPAPRDIRARLLVKEREKGQCTTNRW